MMKLSLMNRVVKTFDANYGCPIADALADRWEGISDVVHRRSSANFVFRATTAEGGRAFLRFNHAKERNVHQILGELAFVHNLKKRGIPAAGAIASSRGDFVETVESELGTFHGVLFEGVPGEEIDPEAMTDDHLAHWGALMGRTHRTSEEFEAGAARRPEWDGLIDGVRRVLGQDGLAVRELDDLEAWLGGLRKDRSNYGLLHFDFDNVGWDGDRIAGIYDFDDCACCWFEADIASCLGGLFAHRPDRAVPDQPGLRAFLEGYRAERHLPDEAVNRIPAFVQLANLLTCARIVYSLGDGPDADELDWMPALREKMANILAARRRIFEDVPVRSVLPN